MNMPDLLSPSYWPDVLSPSTASGCYSFQDEGGEQSSAMPALCFDDGPSNHFDDLMMDCLKCGDIMATGGSLMMAHYDYLWDYDSWHPSAYDTTPIAHDDEEMASLHHMWERWLDATDNMYMKSSTYSQQASSSSAIVANLPQLNLEDYNNTLETTTNLNYDVENTEIDVAVQVKCDIPSLHDGYAWRKYGQKNIKGRSFPRSYYRCAHPSCSIKKQIESSSKSEGYVATYIGKHNH